jgi:hypothetical protein
VSTNAIHLKRLAIPSSVAINVSRPPDDGKQGFMIARIVANNVSRKPAMIARKPADDCEQLQVAAR